MPKELLKKQQGSNNWIVLPLLGIVLFSLAVLVCCNQEKSKEIAPVTQDKEIRSATETASDNTVEIKISSKSTTAEIASFLSDELRRKALGFTSDLIPMNHEQEYKKGEAVLTKTYSWTISFPVTIGMSDAEFSPKEGTDKILVRIKRLKIGKRLAYGDKAVTTIAMHKWKDENSEDETFWAKVDKLTKTRLGTDVLKNKAFTNKLRNKAITVVNGEINKLLEGTEMEHSKFEFIIDKISN